MAKKYRKKDKIYTPIFDVRDRRTLVPYLREVERLEYNSILVLPIFASDRFEISGLVGTVVFYLKDRSALPSEQVDIRANFRALALTLGHAIVDHEKTIAGGSGLVDLLKREYSDQAKRNRRDLIAELTIILHRGGKEKDLDQVAATIMREIGGNEYFGFADYDEADHTKRTIYVVSRDDVERRVLEDRVCALIGKALKGKKGISYDLGFRRKGRPLPGKVINE